jgi:hypothetical protein
MIVEDAKTCVLLIKDPFLFSRSIHETWILDQMFKPISSLAESGINDSCFEILELTTDSHVPNSGSSISTPFPGGSSRAASPNATSIGGIKEREKTLRITPQTRIFTLAEKYRIVFLIDLSASMSTINTYFLFSRCRWRHGKAKSQHKCRVRDVR